MNDELEEALSKMDEEFVQGLTKALRQTPNEIRGKLAELGFIDMYTEHSDVGEGDLSESEELLLEFLESLENPKSAEGIREMIEAEEPELIKEFESFGHRSWLSNKLNKLSKEGYIGKYRDGRSVLYTPDPKEAVRRWALHNNKFVEDIEQTDADKIVSDTGMNRSTTIRSINQLKSES
jgi:hypothetical protein